MLQIVKEFEMGHSQASKAESRERILAVATTQIRKCGLESLSIGPLMERAGMTAGGFYRHFSSRDELVAIVLARALEEGRAASTASLGEQPADFSRIVRSYLSRRHRDSRGDGCAIAALAADVGREGEDLRTIMSERIEGFVSGVAAALDDESDERALVAVCAMVGALSLSRVVATAPRSDHLLRAVRDYLINEMGT